MVDDPGTVEYPYVPKTNTKLRPGHYWPIEFAEGRFACGVYIGIQPNLGHGRSAMIFGILDWEATTEPTREIVESHRHFIEISTIHVKEIEWTGSAIIGWADISKHHYVELLGWDSMIYLGSEPIREVNFNREQKVRSQLASWSARSSKGIAKRYFVDGLPIRKPELRR